MGLHEHLHRRHGARAALPEPAPVQTLVSVVYVTATPTFDGPIGGYTTVGVTADPATAAPVKASTTPVATPQVAKSSAASSAPIVAQSSVAQSSAAPVSSADDSNSSAAPSSLLSSIVADSTSAAASSSTGLPTAITQSTTLASSVPLLAASTALDAKTTANPVASASASASATSTPSSGGMSAGGKAGLAIGILLLVGAILALVLFCFKRRKDQQRQALADHEKNDPFSDTLHRQASVQTTRTSPTAPRLSLRPVTQFLPNLGDKRQSRGNALMTASAPMSEKAIRMDSPVNSQDNRANPFGNHAESIDSANANGPAEVRVMSPDGEIVSAATGVAATGAVAGAATGLARGASKRENAPKPLDFTNANPFMGPPSPAGTEFSTTSDSTASPQQTTTGAAIAAAGGPANSTVHRVQLDFKPSMEDELELKAGQLIRLLHEYDDGWALCIRLDRSQQGVVPRTCLSTRPVKPRPQQPPGARAPPPGMRPGVPQQGRPMSPAGNPGRPMTPTGSQGRPMSPAGGPRSGPPRSMSPGPGRPMTPTGQRGPPQQGRLRSPSAAQMQGRRNSPPGPSPMNPGSSSPPESRGLPARKPVPGQAL